MFHLTYIMNLIEFIIQYPGEDNCRKSLRKIATKLVWYVLNVYHSEMKKNSMGSYCYEESKMATLE